MADAEHQFMETSENGNEEDLNGAELAEEAADEENGGQINASKAEEDAGWEDGALYYVFMLNVDV